ncbi:UPF0331 protein, partial [Frankliniella fusca]
GPVFSTKKLPNNLPLNQQLSWALVGVGCHSQFRQKLSAKRSEEFRVWLSSVFVSYEYFKSFAQNFTFWFLGLESRLIWSS